MPDNIKQNDNIPLEVMETTKKKPAKKLILPIICFIIIAFLLSAFDVRLKIVEYTITSDKITNPIRIALVTDLHSCKYGKNQKTLIDAVVKQNPDIVLLGGDIFDDKIPDENLYNGKGEGFTRVPRIFNRPELVIVNLEPS